MPDPKSTSPTPYIERTEFWLVLAGVGLIAAELCLCSSLVYLAGWYYQNLTERRMVARDRTVNVEAIRLAQNHAHQLIRKTLLCWGATEQEVDELQRKAQTYNNAAIKAKEGKTVNKTYRRPHNKLWKARHAKKPRPKRPRSAQVQSMDPTVVSESNDLSEVVVQPRIPAQTVNNIFYGNVDPRTVQWVNEHINAVVNMKQRNLVQNEE